MFSIFTGICLYFRDSLIQIYHADCPVFVERLAAIGSYQVVFYTARALNRFLDPLLFRTIATGFLFAGGGSFFSHD